MSGLSNLFDSAAKGIKEIQKEVQRKAKHIKKIVTDMKSRLTSNSDAISRINAEIEEVRDELKKVMLDLKCCSMRENLPFYDMPNVDSENCKQTVRQFMCANMHVCKEINLERVHKIRRNSTNSNAQPRDIVAKFSYF